MKFRRIALHLLLALASPLALSGEGPTGTILRQFWSDVGGTAVSDLTGGDDFPDYPTGSEMLSAFEAPTDKGDSYGALIRGYLHPPASGEYIFWIASDDNSELWLSATDDPAKKQLIARVGEWTGPREWERLPTQKSKPVKLEAGKKYYVEALHKEGGGGDNLAVGWQLPGGAQERPIPGNRLSPFVPPKAGPRVPKPPPTTPGHYKRKIEFKVGDKVVKMPYLLYLPPDYVTNKSPKPMLIFLCGVGERGTNLEGVYGWGPDGHILRTPGFKERYPFIGCAPQCADPDRWEMPHCCKTVVAIVDEVIRTYNVDKERVYLTGLSMGGRGTWEVALEAPDRFAAIAPISSVAVRPEIAGQRLKNVSTWIICGGNDGGFTEGSKQMYEIMRKASAVDVKFTMQPGRGHDVWTDYYPTKVLYEWFLEHRRGQKAAPK